MDPVTQQTLTIILGTVAPIFVVGGGAFAWLRSDIRRVEKKSEDAHTDIRSELKDMRGDINDVKQSQANIQVDIAKIQVEVQCLNDKVDSVDRRLDKLERR